MTAHALAGALADERRRTVFAAIVFGARDVPAVVARTGLPARDAATAVRRLTDAGVVADDGGGLRVDGERLREFARAGAAAPAGPAATPQETILRTFLRDGVLVRLPAQRGRRRVLLEHITERAFERGRRYPERAVDAALRPWCDGGAADHVTLRRYLVDDMLLTREDGVYWRTGWSVHIARPDDVEAVVLLREYMAEMVRRWYGRPERPEEVDAALAEDSNDDLVPPTGLLVLARHDGRLAGCVGLRRQLDWSEVTRLYVRPAHRGAGGGAALLAAVEAYAAEGGADRIRLDTRSDLVEARALYARHGYREVPAFNAGPYAQHWFEKSLPARVDDVAAPR
ncbi:GNAT family N-acetyltransferase [Micromonospora sp. DT31]|uniref:GNAT family N-acetyltransferase n=1 Tax=Micromonospora sp. DT31 TaxID=3393434 RepID=UPI003CF7DE6A